VVESSDREPANNEQATWPPVEALADVRWVDHPHPALLDEATLIAQCRMAQMRRGGPGGQHRNKVSTAIGLVHEPTGLTAEASESRDQSRNRRQAIMRLRLRLAVRVRTTLHSNAQTEAADSGLEARYRQLGNDRRLKVSTENEAFPAILTLVLDDLHRSGGQPSLIGPLWNASTTAAVSIVAAWPAALQEVNRWRDHHGRGALRR